MDKVLNLFLSKQFEEGMALAAASDLLELHPWLRPDGPPQKYVARFRCHGFVENQGRICKANRFDVGIFFPDHYLREANAFEVLTWLYPANVAHPNVRPPFLCVGERFMRPGTKLVEIIFQIFAIITYNKWAAHSPLNESAAQWARNNQHLLPADKRPLKRRPLSLQITLNAERRVS
ncbi:MAG: hypothetical protein ABSH08_00980 [Tepidisphaeraceae bacterium]|jgi:hypothetical protein